MDIAVSPVDPADDAVAAELYEIVSGTVRHDIPDMPPVCHYNFRAGLIHPWPGNTQEWWLARVDGVPAGSVHLSFPQLDNPENMSVELNVLPAYRRRGVGRTLYAHTVERAREHGRTNVFGDTVGPLPGGPPRDGAGAAFADAMGGNAALTEVRRRLDVGGVDGAALDALLVEAWPKAAGYSLVQWENGVPEEYVDDLAYLDGRLIEDAPMGDLTWEPEKVDAARVREAERVLAARRRHLYHTGVRHDASGHLVAWTALGFNRSVDWHAWQQITIVEPRHRGHRLGMIVKVENLRYVRQARPQLRIVDTYNAAENDHMISINEAMGFRPVDTMVDWQHKL